MMQLVRKVARARKTDETHPNTVHVFPDQNQTSSDPPVTLHNEPLDLWAEVRCFEFTEKVSRTVPAKTPTFTVDGFCSTGDERRLSLAALGNGARRLKVVQVRQQIGKGVDITYGEGCCRLVNNSESPAFVQSPLHSNSIGLPHHHVYRLPGCVESPTITDRTIEVFNEEYFHRMLQFRKTTNYDGVAQLKEMCEVKVSLVKGFGGTYPRQVVSDTPVWFLMTFRPFLQILDEQLRVMGHTEQACSSFS